MSATDRPLAAAAAGLTRRYGDQLALDGLSFEVRAGDILGFVGANGGGKTTALRILAGLLRPDGGTATVLGHDVARGGADLRALVGYMPQRLALYPDLSVLENLRFHAALRSLPQGAATEAITRYGLDLVARTRFDRLSGGWARRAQFAAAVIANPRLLLLDEPTAGLDPLTRRELWRWLDAYAAGGAAVIVSTHDMAEAERFPAIIHFDGGRPHGPIPPAELARMTGARSLEAAVLALAERQG